MGKLKRNTILFNILSSITLFSVGFSSFYFGSEPPNDRTNLSLDIGDISVDSIYFQLIDYEPIEYNQSFGLVNDGKFSSEGSFSLIFEFDYINFYEFYNTRNFRIMFDFLPNLGISKFATNIICQSIEYGDNSSTAQLLEISEPYNFSNNGSIKAEFDFNSLVQGYNFFVELKFVFNDSNNEMLNLLNGGSVLNGSFSCQYLE